MQHVDQFNFSYPPLVAEDYPPNAVFSSTIAVGPYQGRPCGPLTPPLECPGAGPRYPSRLPTPPPSPPAFGCDEPLRQQSHPADVNNANAWANYLDPGHRLQFQRVLGSGAYGVVHLARDISTGIHYAVKALNKVMPNGLPLDLRQQQFQQTEMRLHYQVSAHPNIVSLLRIMDTRDHTYVIMEYCPEGDLFLNITERGRYVGDDIAAKNVFLQILDAVSHCHRLGIYHRDLKPENILVAQGGHQVKLADFGLATTDMYATEFGCGSTFYMSPECQDHSTGKPYYACAPNDIWSLGVILVNLTCGRNPWKAASTKDSTFRAYMEDRHFLKSILPLSDELNDILGMIFEVDPTRRIKLDELRHRIINCQHFTKPEPRPSRFIEPVEYQVPLSPSSTVSDLSDGGSMISDHSDNSTAASEVDPAPEEDSSPFEVMEEDWDFSPESDFQGHIPEVVSVPKALPEVWDAHDDNGVGAFHDSSLNSYVTSRGSKPLDCSGPMTPPPDDFVPNAVIPVETPAQYVSHSAKSPRENNSGHVNPKFAVMHAPHGQQQHSTRYQWSPRQYSRHALRGVNPWQLRDFINHTLPHRINMPM